MERTSRRPTIRRWLVLLLLATVVPLLAFTAAVLFVHTRLIERVAEEPFVDTARALAVAVHRDLRAVESALQALATSPLLDSGNLPVFYERAVEIGRLHGGWIVLLDRDNQQLLNTALPRGSALPPGAVIDAFNTVLRTARPVVTDVFTGAVLQRPVIGVFVPVVRRRDVRFVLVMGLLPERILDVLDDQQVDPTWRAAVYDRTGRTIAGVPNGTGGGPSAAPDLLAAMRRDREGWLRSTSSDFAGYFAFARVPHADWTVVLGIPAAAPYVSATRSLYLILGAGVVAIVLGSLLATIIGRRITAPLAAVAAAARASDPDAELRTLEPVVAEVAEVWQALRDAGERRRQLAAAESARAEAEATSRRKDEFLATLSHELRTPLTSILSWVRMLRSGRLDAASTAHALEVIERNVAAQTLLIRDLLDVNRIIRGALALDMADHDLSRIVGDACDMLRPTADANGVALTCDLDRGIRGMLDAGRMQQVVWNLVTNAVKFTPRGGRVDVRLERLPDRRARLTVRDNGQGFPPEVAPGLFERFRQLEADASPDTRGLGIGLAIVKYLVEHHDGTVSAASPGPGEGATFTVELPLRAASESRSPVGSRSERRS